MNTLDLQAAAQDLMSFIHQGIPLTRAMALKLRHYDGKQLSLSSPLNPNVNDKGCAFAGSLVSLMTIAGWALVVLKLNQQGEDCDVFVGTSTISYLSPVWNDFHATAQLDQNADWTTFFNTLADRHRARIAVSCTVLGEDGNPAATLAAQFVAKRRSIAQK